MKALFDVLVYSSEIDADLGCNLIATITVSTPKQLEKAVALYVRPEFVLKFISPEGQDCGPLPRADALLVGAIKREVIKKLRTNNARTADLVYATGISRSELWPYLQEMSTSGQINFLSMDIWSLNYPR